MAGKGPAAGKPGRPSAATRRAGQEGLIRSISDNLPSGMIYQVSRLPAGSRRFTYLSAAVRTLYGITPEEGMADAGLIYGRVHPEDRERVLAAEEEAHRTLSEFRCEVRMLAPDGSYRWTAFVSRPRRFGDGTTAWDGLAMDISERKRAEEALERANARFEHLASSVPALLAYVDAATLRYEYANAQYAQAFGREPGAIAGRHLREVIGEAGFALDSPLLDEVRAGRPAGCERVFSLVTGERWLRASYAPVLDAGGRVASIAVLAWDTTEQRRAEEALRKSRKLLGETERVGKVGGWEFDVDTGRQTWTEGVHQIHEVAPGFQPTLEAGIGFYTPESRPVIAEAVRRAVERDEPFDLELEIVTAKGNRRSVHVIGKADPEHRRVHGFFQDVTERSRLQRDGERLAVAIEQAAEIVMVTDERGTILYVNPVFEAVTGYSRAEAVGRNARLLRSGEQGEEFYRRLWETISAGRVWEGRIVNRRKDGALYTEEMTISPVRGAGGRIISYVAVKRDMTEHLRVHEEKRRLEEQLLQAQKVEAIGRLAGGVAHDFNNLTAIVLGYGEILLGQLRPDDPARKLVEQIVAAGQRSAALTRQLLAFSRRQTLQPEVLDLNALLRNIQRMIGRLIGEDIVLEPRLAAGLGRVLADPGQLEQVVTNLVINARDAMPDGGRLTIETADVLLDGSGEQDVAGVVPGPYVMLSLTDTGRGMDRETLAHLFEPFFTTKEKGKGTGLGLATVYGIVKQSHGFIWADSEPGKGARFRIYLPRTEGEAAAAPGAVGAEIPRGRGEGVLLVEDEPALRELCRTLLERLGYRTAAAGSGPEALRLVREGLLEPDLLLTDVVMPEMNGPALAEQLRSGRPGLKVLFMSGYPDDAIARHGVLDPGLPFIQKPFSERSLAGKVRETLDAPAAAARGGKRVLMIDDDEQFRSLVGHFCARREHRFTGVGTAPDALAALAAGTFDVLLVDLNLPGTDGVRLLREIRAAGHAAPAVVLTGDAAAADPDALRSLGAVRVLEKSSRPGPLLDAIDAAAGGGMMRAVPPGGGVLKKGGRGDG